MRAKRVPIKVFAYHKVEKQARKDAYAKLEGIGIRYGSMIDDIHLDSRKKGKVYEGEASGILVVLSAEKSGRRGKFGWIRRR
jgi:hypothetical protein